MNKTNWIHVLKFGLPNKSKGCRKISLKESCAYSRPLEKSQKRITHSHAIQSFVSFNFHLKLLQLFLNLYYFYNCLLIHGFVFCFFFQLPSLISYHWVLVVFGVVKKEVFYVDPVQSSPHTIL